MRHLRDLGYRIFVCFLIMVLVVPLHEASAKSGRKKYKVSARSAIFSNSTQVKRYYGKNAHMRVLPASTTKVMTALVVLDRLPLDEVVTVGNNVGHVQPTVIGLRPGEKYRVRDLLLAILVKSANDASIVLAEAVAGSESSFVELMNEKARQIGANHTKFANSNGLPTKTSQYTTAYDMYLMFREGLNNDFFRRAIKVRYMTIASLDGREIAMKSHNKILHRNWKQNIYGKTGYTRGAQQCFVGYFMKGNDVCIISVFGCTRRWDDIKYIVERYSGVDL